MLIFCSRKSMRICKTLRRKSIKIYIEIAYSSNTRVIIRHIFQEGLIPWSDEWFAQAQSSEITIEHSSELEEETQELVRIGGHKVPVTSEIVEIKENNIPMDREKGEIELRFYFDEKFDGLKILAEFFTWFFNSPVDEVRVSTKQYPDQISKTIDWVLSQQESIPFCFIEDDRVTDEHIRDVLDVSNFVKTVFISVKPTDSFSHQFIYNNEFLTISNAFWFNLQNLFNVNCSFIELEGTKLTSWEMNWFLRHWINGWFFKMRVVDIEMEEIHLQSLFAGLNVVEFPAGERRVFKNTVLIFCSQKSMRTCKTLRNKSNKVWIGFHYFSGANVTLRDTFIEDLLPWSEEKLSEAQISEIYIENSSELEEREQKLVSIRGHNVPMTFRIDEKGEVELSLYFKDTFDGLKILVEYLTWFFDSPIDEVIISSVDSPDKIKRTIDWIVSQQETIPHCHIEDDQITDERIRDVLDVSNFAEEILIGLRPTDTFSHQFTFNNDVITLLNAFWFNLQNLFNVDCRVIQLNGTKLTSQEMNQYLRRWINGEFSKIKIVDIGMEEIDLQSLLEDLNAVNFPEGEERFYKTQNNEERVVDYGFDITRNDGTVATIEHEGGNIVSKRFFFVVW
ncbi:hypothetical protein CAEBREN_16359 [Caenorhabditis brenneri]|uniref:Sdz-33 F-box domain-containing protein n=1 Tax=Caenorhabditis brenneri TaxID=135651 RepID=G0MDW9_CAEBE|nr:hypothetical protein CAEBREN_16359 [Caenorhabditis brenneri]